jgi:hypothetical protein
MAGPSLRSAQTPSDSATTRTRRIHGAIVISGGEQIGVFSSRRQAHPSLIGLNVGGRTEGPALTRFLDPAGARALAASLLRAAEAVDLAQRFTEVARGGATHG